MADDSKLSGKVTVDAVPLESLIPSGEGIELIPRPATTRFEHPQTDPQSTSAPGYSTQPLTSAVLPVQPTRSVQLQPQAQGTRREAPSHQSAQQPQGHPQNVQGPSPSQHHTVLPGDLQSRSGVSGSQDSEDECSLDRDVLKGISKAVGKGLSDTDRSAQNRSQSPTSESISSLVPVDSMSTISDGEIKKYSHMFPDKLKVDFFDAMILYEASDSKAVNRFLKRVNTDVWLNNTVKPEVVLYDQILPCAGMTAVGQLDRTLDHCTYVFLYVTRRFCEDGWSEFSAQTCLMNAIENAESKWSVVPIFTEPKRNRTFKIPASIRSLKGIQYWNDDNFYVDCLRKLLEDKLYIRLQKAGDLTERRKRWILEMKGEERRQAERKRQEEQHVIEMEKEKDKQNQRDIQHKELLFQQKMQAKQQDGQLLEFQIHTLQEGLRTYGYQGSISQNPETAKYLADLFQHMAPPGSAKKSESFAENPNQQGMAELPYVQHSWSMPSYYDPMPHAAYSQGTKQQQTSDSYPRPQSSLPQQYPGDWRMESGGSQSAPNTPAPNTPAVTVPIRQVGQSWQQAAGQQPGIHGMNSAQRLPTASGVYGSLSGQSVDGGQPSKPDRSSAASQSFLQASTSLEPARQHADRNMEKQVTGDGKDPDAQSVKGSGEKSAEQEVSISQIEKSPNKFLHRGDLVEDVPLDSHCYQGYGFSAVPHPERSHMGWPNMSEAIRQPTLVVQGAAHASRRTGSEPEERGDEQCGPRMMFRGSPGMGDRFSGLGPVPQPFMYPLPYAAHLARQFHPPYMGHIPSPFPVQFPQGYQGSFPFSYPGSFPPPYPYMHPDYARLPPPAPLSTEHGANLQYSRLPQSHGRPSPEAPPPYQHSPPPQPPQHQNENQQATVVHYHYHSRTEEDPPRTININKAENVMLANQISVGDERMSVAHPHPPPAPHPTPEQPAVSLKAGMEPHRSSRSRKPNSTFDSSEDQAGP